MNTDTGHNAFHTACHVGMVQMEAALRSLQRFCARCVIRSASTVKNSVARVATFGSTVVESLEGMPGML